MLMKQIDSSMTRLLLPNTKASYALVKSARGVWLQDVNGREYLDAMSGGSMAMTLGYGRDDIITSARRQAESLMYIHNEWLTNPAQERLAEELIEVAPTGFSHVRFVTGGSEANEMAIQLARIFHVERGEPQRWRVISPAQAYHGSTMMTLALTGRPALYSPYDPYLSQQLHIPPSTWHSDPTGEAALAELDRVIEEAGPETISVFFCEPISAAALPGYSPPQLFWEGLEERRKRHGFLIAFDEVVTGVGRVGQWFAAQDMPLTPDLISTAKGLGAGYVVIGAVLCRKQIFEAVASGGCQTPLGHTWDGAPLPCAVARAVLKAIKTENVIERVRSRGISLREEISEELLDVPIVKEVRGKGFLIGVHFCDPRDKKSFLPAAISFAKRIDEAAMAQGLITLSTQPTKDGYAGDSTLFAPALTSTDQELEEMKARFSNVIHQVAREVEKELEG